MCNSIYAWYNPHSPLKPKQLSQMMFDLLLAGICGIWKKSTPCQVELSQ
jgi:hypothetical protein